MARKISYLSVAFVCCLLASCGDSPEVIAAKKAEAQMAAKKAEEAAAAQKEEADVKQAVTRALKDPNSAIFGDIFYGEWVTSEKDGISIKRRMCCVTVNAKNSFGGYTGDRQVLVMTVSASGISIPAVVPHDGSPLTVEECRGVISKMTIKWRS